MCNGKSQVRGCLWVGGRVGGGVRDVERLSTEGNALGLVLGVGYRSLHDCQNVSAWTLTICAPIYILIIYPLQN